MEHAIYLLKQNRQKETRLRLSNGEAVLECCRKKIDGSVIENLIRTINGLLSKYNHIRIPIAIKGSNIIFADKLAYITLECLCYAIVSGYGHDVRVRMGLGKNNDAYVGGVKNSPLWDLASKDRSRRSIFVKSFMNQISEQHFRMVARRTRESRLSELTDDIVNFLTHIDFPENPAEDIAEAVTELVGNSWEHASEECLFDIDITNLERRDIASNEEYFGVNIVVVNFSETLFGDKLKEKLLQYEPKGQRYADARMAYEYHKKFFSTKYLEDDFFNILCFQDHITGRLLEENAGGKGLTTLLKSLAELSEFHFCYLLSGNRGLLFEREFLTRNSGWIGFNRSGDFLEELPDEQVVLECKTFFPGTAYNLNFIMRKQ